MEIYQNRFILSLYFVLISTVFGGTLSLLSRIQTLSEDEQLLVLLLCIFLLLLTGSALIKGIFNICKPKLILRITEEGFEHNGIGFIKWTEVTNLYTMNAGSLNFINYQVNNYSEITKNWSFLKKMFHNSDQSFSICLAGTGQKINKIAEIMQKYLEDSRQV